MLARRWMLSVLVALVLWPAVAHGQSRELNDAYNRAGELYAQGRYQEALPFAEEALRLSECEFSPDHLTTATMLHDLAVLYDDLGRYPEAGMVGKITIR